MRALAARLAARHPQLLCFGYFGSYARGDWGPGSDVDLVAVVKHAHRPFEARSLDFDLGKMPVPAELLVYTLDEWQAAPAADPFRRCLENETVWVHP